MAFLLLAGRASARAFPPLRPPLRPMLARYCRTDGDASSVDSLTTSNARWLISFGSFLLERLMQRLWQDSRQGQYRLTLRMRHYPPFAGCSANWYSERKQERDRRPLL